jgi:ABC-type branched-subunit amino acid transport system substrate-binding protein
MNKFKLVLTAMLALVFCAAPAPTRAETGVTDDEILFGSCLPMTGDNMINGLAYREGAKAYFDYINDAKGGVNGRKIKLLSEDDGYDVDRAIVCYKHLLEENVFATGLTVGTPTAAKYVLLAENNKVPFIANGGGPKLMSEPLRKYVFAVRASYDDESRVGVDHLWNDVGARKFAVIYQNDALGASGLDAVKAALAAHESAPAAAASYVRNTDDIDAAYAAVKAVNPDVVYIAGVTMPTAAVLKKAKADGWKPIFVALPGRDTQLIASAKEAADDVIIGNPTPISDMIQFPSVALYRRALKKYAPEAKISAISLQSFVDAMIIVEGLRRAGKELTREKFVQALESMGDYDAGLGPEFKVRYSKETHKAFDHVFFSTIRHGKPAPILNWQKDVHL